MSSSSGEVCLFLLQEGPIVSYYLLYMLCCCCENKMNIAEKGSQNGYLAFKGAISHTHTHSVFSPANK